MFTTILLILMYLALAIGLYAHFRITEPGVRRRSTILLSVFASIAVVITFFSTFTLVRAVEVGVPVTFGSVGRPLPPGIHFTLPWTDVETYPTRPLNVDVRAQVRTADAGKVTVTATGRWNVSVTNARELYFQVRTGDEERISEEVVSRNLSQAIGDVYNDVSNVDATKRDGRADAIKARVQTLLRTYGIDIVAIQLREVEPDPVTAQSIADFAAQQRKTKIAEEGNKTAAADATRRLTEANGIKRAAAQLSGISPIAAQLLCVQEWTNAVSAGRLIYTNPCTGSGVTPTLPVK
jgi:regulator of protease activity HflC (stomatin/prohibitin superfamily)